MGNPIVVDAKVLAVVVVTYGPAEPRVQLLVLGKPLASNRNEQRTSFAIMNSINSEIGFTIHPWEWPVLVRPSCPR